MPIIGHVLHEDPTVAHHLTPSRSDPARPSWITPELIALTRATWQPYYPQPLTDDDAVEMLLNVSTLYRVLAEDSDEFIRQGDGETSAPPIESHCSQAA